MLCKVCKKVDVPGKWICPDCEHTVLQCVDELSSKTGNVHRRYYCIFCKQYYITLIITKKFLWVFNVCEQYFIEEEKANRMVEKLKANGVIADVKFKD